MVLVTASSRAEACRLAEAIIRARAAACCNIIPNLRSFFYWQGQLNRSPEALLVIKTTRAKLPALRRLVTRLHSYTVPEIIAWPVGWGHQPYLRWVRGACGKRAGVS